MPHTLSDAEVHALLLILDAAGQREIPIYHALWQSYAHSRDYPGHAQQSLYLDEGQSYGSSNEIYGDTSPSTSMVPLEGAYTSGANLVSGYGSFNQQPSMEAVAVMRNHEILHDTIGIQGAGGDGNPGGGPNHPDPAHLWGPKCRRGSARDHYVNAMMASVAGINNHANNRYDLDTEMEEMHDARANEIEGQEVQEAADNQPREEGAQSEEQELSHDPSVPQPIPEKQALGPNAQEILLRLSWACREILEDESGLFFTNAVKVLTSLCSDNIESRLWNAAEVFRDNSLDSIALHCTMAENKGACTKFILYLSMMHFRTKVESQFMQLKSSGHSYGVPKRTQIFNRISLAIDPCSPNKVSPHVSGSPKRQKKNKSLSRTDRKNSALNKETRNRRFRDWVKRGSAYCLLAGAGSIYLLVVAACGDLNGLISDTKMNQIARLAATIRCPPPGTHGDLVRRDIIPAMAKLRQMFDIKVLTMFSSTITDAPVSVLPSSDNDNLDELCSPSHEECHDVYEPSEEDGMELWASQLKKTDIMFDNIKYDCFIKKRCWKAWKACSSSGGLSPGAIVDYHDISLSNMLQTPYFAASTSIFLPGAQVPSRYPSSLPSSSPTHVPSSRPSTPGSILSDDCFPPVISPDASMLLKGTASDSDYPVYVIDTAYDPAKNVKYSPGRRSSVDEIFKYTQQERQKTLVARIPGDREELKALLQAQLSTGEKTKDSYIRITSELLNGEPLRINDKNGDMLILINPTMPDDIRKNSLTRLRTIFGSTLKYTDTLEGGQDLHFTSLHFSWYNRYSMQFIPADDNEAEEVNNHDPAGYQREGKRKVNTSTMIPRASVELEKYSGIHNLLSTSLDRLLAWQKLELENLLPAEYEAVERFANCLPGAETLAAYPFSGLVINLNAATRIHRDWNDSELCTVIVISDCVGGALGLMEVGVVLDLHSGDSTSFRSSKLSHFNEDFKGERISIVFHSDQDGNAWVESRNGWEEHAYFGRS